MGRKEGRKEYYKKGFADHKKNPLEIWTQRMGKKEGRNAEPDLLLQLNPNPNPLNACRSCQT